jgi:hypothetical protein
MESQVRSSFLFPHDLIAKPVATFADHALGIIVIARRLAAVAIQKWIEVLARDCFASLAMTIISLPLKMG